MVLMVLVLLPWRSIFLASPPAFLRAHHRLRAAGLVFPHDSKLALVAVHAFFTDVVPVLMHVVHELGPAWCCRAPASLWGTC